MGRNRARRRFNWFFLVLLVIGTWFSYTVVSQQIQLNAVAKDYEETKTRLETAQARNEALKKEKEALHDAAYIEKVARETLGMTRQGEVPYISVTPQSNFR